MEPYYKENEHLDYDDFELLLSYHEQRTSKECLNDNDTNKVNKDE